MEKLSIIKIANPFDRFDRDVCTIEYRRGESLLDLQLREFALDVPVVVSLNGRTVPKNELEITYPRSGDQILMVPELQGGGKGIGKTILRVVAMIVVAIVAWYAAPAILGVASMADAGVAGAAIAAGITAVGGLVVNALIPAPKPAANAADVPGVSGTGMDASQTYGWGPTTLQQQGVPIPHVYGLHRVYGNVLGGYIIDGYGNEQYANALIGIGMGPIAGLYDFWINDLPVSGMRGVGIACSYGLLDQAPHGIFYHTVIEHSLSLGLNDGIPVYWTSINDDFDALDITLQWPQGLYRQPTPAEQQQINELLTYYPQYASQLTVRFYAQIVQIHVRKLGDTVWTPVTREAVTTSYEVSIGHWSAGEWVTVAEEVPDIDGGGGGDGGGGDGGGGDGGE